VKSAFAGQSTENFGLTQLTMAGSSPAMVRGQTTHYIAHNHTSRIAAIYINDIFNLARACRNSVMV
jgi:hypothetical protein